MKNFIQYDESGKITATVTGDIAPLHPRQLEFDELPDLDGKVVNLDTKTLVDAKPVEGAK